MLTALLEHIVLFIDDFVPWFTIKEYEEAIILRFGKYIKRKSKGIYLKIPFFDKVLKENIITTTLSLDSQSLVTKDDKTIEVKGVVKYNIEDVKMFLLGVYDANDAIADIAQSVIATECSKKDWKDLKEDTLDNEISKKARVQLKKYGIFVETVTLTDKTLTRALRIFMQKNNNT